MTNDKGQGSAEIQFFLAGLNTAVTIQRIFACGCPGEAKTLPLTKHDSLHPMVRVAPEAAGASLPS